LPLIAQDTKESGTVVNYREDRMQLTKFLEDVCQRVIDTYLEVQTLIAKRATEEEEEEEEEDNGFDDHVSSIARYTCLCDKGLG
jgi:hypothetical protein